MTEILAALAGIAIGLFFVTRVRAWLVERTFLRVLVPLDTVPWALHNLESFSEFLRHASPEARILGRRTIGRMLKTIKDAHQVQIALYSDPPQDDGEAATCLEKAGLLRELDLSTGEAREALGAIEADQHCMEPRGDFAEYHPSESPKGAFNLVSEIDPLAGAVLAWPVHFPKGWKHHAEFTRHVTTGGKALLAVPSLSWQKCVQLYLERSGVALENVVFLRNPTSDVWVRDFGPTFVRSERGDIAVITNAYVPYEHPFQNADDQFPIEFARQFGIPAYRLPIVVEGGNIVADGRGTIVMCDSVLDRNPQISEARLREIMEAYFGCQQLIILPSLAGEVTGHADMVVKFLDPETVAVASADPSYHWSDTFDEIANRLSQTRVDGGRTRLNVVRVPGVHTSKTNPKVWGYINALTVNRTVILPRYDLPSDAVAEKIFTEHLPNFEILSVDMRDHLVGAVHCQAKEVPAALSPLLSTGLDHG